METAPVVLSETKTYQGNYEGRWKLFLREFSEAGLNGRYASLL
jgi:hypothetical protein